MHKFVGQNVRFHFPDGSYRPAFITKILDNGEVNLQVIPDHGDAVMLGQTRALVPMLGVMEGETSGCWSGYPV